MVKFPDLPEVITQGENEHLALIEATDCLEECLANRIEMKLDIPLASRPKKQQHTVSVDITIAAKAALYLAMREQQLNNSVLAKKLHVDEKEVRRLLDPHYRSKLPRIEHALHLLGQRLNIRVVALDNIA